MNKLVEHAKIAEEQYRDYKDMVTHNGDAWNADVLYELQRRVYFANRELFATQECSCLPDLPDGRINGGRGHVCPACAVVDSTDEIPFGGE